jgi:putative transposase
MSAAQRRGIVDIDHPRLSIRQQCKLLQLNRSTYYYQPQGESPYNLELIRTIDELTTDLPFLGSRQMRSMLVDLSHPVGCGRQALLFQMLLKR